MHKDDFLEQQKAAYWAMRSLREEANRETSNREVDFTSDSSERFMSLTSNAMQAGWVTPTLFPLCPKKSLDISIKTPLGCYADNLEVGLIVCENKFGISLIDEFCVNGDELLIRIHSSSGTKRYGVISVKYVNGYYIHKSVTFFEERGAKKEICIRLGKLWEGGDGIDDYC